MSDFQFDLLVPPYKISKTAGHLIAIDLSSRMAFSQPYTSKANMIETFTSLFNQIHKKQPHHLFQDKNDLTTFFSDKDTTFYHHGKLISSFQKLEKKKSIKFLPLLGFPYVVDRLSRSLRNIFAYEFQTEVLDLKKYNLLIKKSIDFYNEREHSTLGTSPLAMLKSGPKMNFLPVDFTFTKNRKKLLSMKKKSMIIFHF